MKGPFYAAWAESTLKVISVPLQRMKLIKIKTTIHMYHIYYCIIKPVKCLRHITKDSKKEGNQKEKAFMC